MALAGVCGLAAGAFAFGAALGDGPPPRPSVASQLTRAQLAGQRLVLGFQGTRFSDATVRLIRDGSVAGIILLRTTCRLARPAGD